MLDTVKRTISDYMMLETGENVLVALSGGADSTVLLLSLRELGYPVRAFHLNHCLRGAESDRDEAFCRRLCEKLGVELTVERVDIAAAAGDSAVEETARRIRYARLEYAAHGAKIAVAHNADDNLETMLFHLVRGTGAKGLTGIPPVRGRIIRPLIEVERREIEAFLRERGPGFRHGQHERGHGLYAQPPPSRGRSRSAGIESAGGAGGSTAFASASAGRDLPAELCTDLCTTLCSRERRVEDSASAGSRTGGSQPSAAAAARKCGYAAQRRNCKAYYCARASVGNRVSVCGNRFAERLFRKT